jgi:ATP-dependent RNA helicase SUPV3L1/SUV3
MPDTAPVTAVLGPTNTGKTHRAIERMLAYDSGMIGLPLRLLAREVYDRITARIGEAKVALVTGEEKRVPRRPDYWVCTVEAMPMDIEVEFLAVDEIQLAAHAQRGHVFTDRLLSARGLRETWFMGAGTMRSIVSELLPAAKIVEHPRLSSLTYAGADKLARLPPRSAVVAFGMGQVYALAERLRAKRGGAAVVLGALSPRTRNAQVALFQAGEVDYLVATDAIGMGLNLDVNHVAFASLRKFDGRAERELEPAELSQIAGRAGRYLRAGTFGAVTPTTLPASVALAIEAHRFPDVRRLVYRSSDLDLSSIDALSASLRQRPCSGLLRLVEGAEDTAALAKLAEDPEVRARVAGAKEAVGLLWDVCRVPDFQKLLLESHVALLAEIFAQLTGPAGVLDPDWMAERVAAIDDASGDIDTLLARIARVRTWTYISHQAQWMKGASAWQERTRAIEDRLSDALHERLVQRFVEQRAGKRTRPKRASPGPAGPQATEQGAPRPSGPFAVLASLRARLAPGCSGAAQGAQPTEGAWVESLVAAGHARFRVDERGRILDGDRPVGKLMRGTGLLLPEARLVGLDDLGAGARSRLLRRLTAFGRDLVDELLAALRTPAIRALSPAARGLVYQLEQGLGTADARAAEQQRRDLLPGERETLRAHGVEIGDRVLYVPNLLKREAVTRRRALASAYFDGAPLPERALPGAVSFAPARGVDLRACAAIGYPVFGPRAVRADIAERAHRALAEGAPSDGQLAGLLGCGAREVARVREGLVGAEAPPSALSGSAAPRPRPQ